MFAAPAVLREATCAWVALAVVAEATYVVAVLVGQKDVGAEIDRLSKPLSRRPSRAKCARSCIVSSIVTSTSASFGIGFAVASEPTSAMRKTPGMLRAARTNAGKTTSRGLRDSAIAAAGS